MGPNRDGPWIAFCKVEETKHHRSHDSIHTKWNVDMSRTVKPMETEGRWVVARAWVRPRVWGFLGERSFFQNWLRALHNLVHKLKTIAFYFFLPHCVACRILIPQPGMKPGHSREGTESWALDHQGTPLNCPFQMSELQGMWIISQ